MAYLVVNIDTEEEGLFGQRYPTSPWRLGHLAELPRLQDIFDRFGVRPSYQVTTPVVQDAAGSSLLEKYLNEGRCDIGGHLHTWSTEPLDHPIDDDHSMPCMLDIETVREKLITLTDQIRDRFGIQPVTYRSGRYGSAAEHTQILTELGYRVESSVCPFVSHAQFGGPDYLEAPIEPYWLGNKDMLKAEPAGQLLSIPISAGFNKPCFELAGRIHKELQQQRWSRFHVIGMLHRTHLLRLIRLNPEMTSLKDMLSLCRAKLRRKDSMFHMTFHSSNIGTGGTPYVPTQQARDEFLNRISSILDFLVVKHGVQPITSREYHEIFLRQTGAHEETGKRQTKAGFRHENRAALCPS